MFKQSIENMTFEINNQVLKKFENENLIWETILENYNNEEIIIYDISEENIMFISYSEKTYNTKNCISNIYVFSLKNGKLKLNHKFNFKNSEYITDDMIEVDENIIKIPFNAYPEMTDEELIEYFDDEEISFALIDYAIEDTEEFSNEFNDFFEKNKNFIELNEDEQFKIMKKYYKNLNSEIKLKFIKDNFFETGQEIIGKIKEYNLDDLSINILEGNGYGDLEDWGFSY